MTYFHIPCRLGSECAESRTAGMGDYRSRRMVDGSDGNERPPTRQRLDAVGRFVPGSSSGVCAFPGTEQQSGWQSSGLPGHGNRNPRQDPATGRYMELLHSLGHESDRHARWNLQPRNASQQGDWNSINRQVSDHGTRSDSFHPFESKYSQGAHAGQIFGQRNGWNDGVDRTWARDAGAGHRMGHDRGWNDGVDRTWARDAGAGHRMGHDRGWNDGQPVRNGCCDSGGPAVRRLVASRPELGRTGGTMSDAIQQNKDIIAQRSEVDLARLVLNRANKFNHVNVATALHRYVGPVATLSSAVFLNAVCTRGGKARMK